jgi:hypothetical protein
MRRTAIGFAAGSIFTSIVFLAFFDVSSRSGSTADLSGLDSADTEIPSPTRARIGNEPEPALTNPGDDPAGSGAGESFDDANSSDFFEPVRTPPEFDLVSEEQVYWHHDSWRAWHQRLEREPRDSDWSFATEAALNAAFSARPEIGRYGTPVVHCRSRTCQVQMLAYGANDVDVAEWSSRFGSVYREVADEFEMGDFSVAREAGLTTMVLHIQKRELPTAESIR